MRSKAYQSCTILYQSCTSLRRFEIHFVSLFVSLFTERETRFRGEEGTKLAGIFVDSFVNRGRAESNIVVHGQLLLKSLRDNWFRTERTFCIFRPSRYSNSKKSPIY